MKIMAIFVESKRRLVSIFMIQAKWQSSRSVTGRTRERESQGLSFYHSQLWGSGRLGCAAPLGSNQSRMRTEVRGDFERSHFGVVRGDIRSECEV